MGGVGPVTPCVSHVHEVYISQSSHKRATHLNGDLSKKRVARRVCHVDSVPTRRLRDDVLESHSPTRQPRVISALPASKTQAPRDIVMEVEH